jgi:O-methyltransferase
MEKDPGELRLWPAFPPANYLGQLEPAFQSHMAELRAPATLDDCEWYHSFTRPDGSEIAGAWDLRGGEAEYLGGTDFAGQRVLELGPASGYLTFWMERQGAEVVALEPGFDVTASLIPFKGRDMWEETMNITRVIDRVHNAWWFMHREYGSSAKLVHADIYRMPGDLGQFDIAVFGAILLHLRDPWGALAEAARRTTRRIVVTDVIQDPDARLEDNIMRFGPGEEHHITNWWNIYPGAVIAMLTRLGFPRSAITRHYQPHHLGHHLDEPAHQMPMWTVVAERA